MSSKVIQQQTTLTKLYKCHLTKKKKKEKNIKDTT